MSFSDIKQLLTYFQFRAIKNANSPAPTNPFATMNDLPFAAAPTTLLTNIVYFDDFVEATTNYNASIAGGGLGGFSSNGPGAIAGTTDPYTKTWWINASSTANNAVAQMIMSNSTALTQQQDLYVGYGQMTYEGRVLPYMNPLTAPVPMTNCRMFVGMWDVIGVFPTNGIFFCAEKAISNNWLARTSNGGIQTSVDTGVPFENTERLFKIVVNAAGTAVDYYLDNVLVATINTNIPGPTAGLNVKNIIINTAAGSGGQRRLAFEWLRFKLAYTNPKT